MKYDIASLLLGWAVMAVLLFMIFMFASTAWAEVNHSPAVEYICFNRDVQADLEELGVPEWAKVSISILMDGRIGKGPVDIIEVSPTETAIGWAHFHLQRGRLGLNLTIDSDHEAIRALLYDDRATAIQYAAYRRIVDPAVRESGYRTDEELSLVGSISTSGPSWVRRLGRGCEWDSGCLAKEYGSDNAHRQYRVETWRRRWE